MSPMHSPRIDAIIFDCDGTLVDSVPLAREALAECLSALHLAPGVTDAAVRLFNAGKLAESLARCEVLLGIKLPTDFVAVFRRARADAVRARLRPMPGAHALLGALNLPVAVASNGPLEQTQLSLQVTDLQRYFGRSVFSAYELDRWKPDPDLFLHAAAAMGVHPSRCAVVEDSLSGVHAGIAAGMTVFSLFPEVPQHAAQVHRIASLHEIGQYLANAG